MKYLYIIYKYINFYTYLYLWSKTEFKGMFHELLAFLKEHVPLSITSIDDFNASFIHMPYRDLI